MSIAANLIHLKSSIPPAITLVAISKTHPASAVMEAYQAGHRDFGENKVQELLSKAAVLPNDVQWHLVGHLQSNKVKQVVPFVYLIHSVDSLKLLLEIEKQSAKINRVTDVLLQVHIADEETKFGFNPDEISRLIASPEIKGLEHVLIRGLMGMATNTSKKEQVQKEFRGLKWLFDEVHDSLSGLKKDRFDFLSMGMSSDYELAIKEGSNMIRVGSAIFGSRT